MPKKRSGEKMSIFDLLFPKKEKTIIKEEKFILPDYFEIKDKDINYYNFMLTGKTYTSKKELEENEEMIDRNIEEYKNTQMYKILSTDINELDIKAISVSNLSYQDSNLDTTLEINDEIYNRYFLNPSKGLVFQKKMIEKKNEPLSLGFYLKSYSSSFINPFKIIYRKGKDLEFVNKSNDENINKETTFLSNVEERNAHTITEYILQEKIMNYELKLIEGDPRLFIENLMLNNEQQILLDNFCHKIKLNDFIDLSILLNKQFNNRISFISKVNDIIIIKGNNQEENIIYTTLKKEELSDTMKQLLDEKIKKHR